MNLFSFQFHILKFILRKQYVYKFSERRVELKKSSKSEWILWKQYSSISPISNKVVTAMCEKITKKSEQLVGGR